MCSNPSIVSPPKKMTPRFLIRFEAHPLKTAGSLVSTNIPHKIYQICNKITEYWFSISFNNDFYYSFWFIINCLTWCSLYFNALVCSHFPWMVLFFYFTIIHVKRAWVDQVLTIFVIPVSRWTNVTSYSIGFSWKKFARNNV